VYFLSAIQFFFCFPELLFLLLKVVLMVHVVGHASFIRIRGCLNPELGIQFHFMDLVHFSQDFILLDLGSVLGLAVLLLLN